MANQLTAYTALELRVETPRDVLYLTRRDEVLPELWTIRNMLGYKVGEVTVRAGYAEVYVEGALVFQNNASLADDHFDDNDLRIGMLTYIAEHLHMFKA